jgi:hypothetical protein
MPRGQRFPIQTMLRAMREVDNGVPIGVVCRKIGMSRRRSTGATLDIGRGVENGGTCSHSACPAFSNVNAPVADAARRWRPRSARLAGEVAARTPG